MNTFSSAHHALALLLLGVTLASAYKLDLSSRRSNPQYCRDRSGVKCCQGQNNTCFVFGTRMDQEPTSKRCYCDANCLIMGDCCMDYPSTCRSVNCEVQGWATWTTCDNACGYGSRRRVRKVAVYPDNGGSNCPVLKQRRACVGYEQDICDQNLLGEQTEEKAEQARILPLEFGTYRTDKKFDPWRGILKNLYNKYFNEIFTRATYRGKFKITKAHYGCIDSEWADVLKENATVCVECQPVAMNREIGMRCLGHGVYRTRTAWKAVDVSKCHGEWELVEGHSPDTCEYNVADEHSRNFIFI